MNWEDGVNVAITVSNAEGTIIYMNPKAIKTFEKYGGANLIGKSIYEVHSGKSLDKLKKMTQGCQENTYTIEKNGIKKLIHQIPWLENGQFMGFVEFSFEIPLDMPHYIRS